MKTLDIVFTESAKTLPIGSLAIKLYTGKPYSHVAVQQEVRDWGKRYFQASEGKVNYEFEKFFLKKHRIVRQYTIEISPELDRAIKKACYLEAGNAYGTMQNLGIVLVDFLKIFNIRATNPWKSGRNCSELIYVEVLKRLMPRLDLNPDTVKPHQLEEIILNNFTQLEDGNWILMT